MKENKGITLIALIITIVVMLILVGITINVVLNSNILGSAKNAGKKWQDEEQKEATESNIIIDGVEYASIEAYLNANKEVTNPYNPDGWVAAWTCPDGGTSEEWSDMINHGEPAEGDIVAKLYETTGNPIISMDEVLYEGGDYNFVLVIEGEGAIGDTPNGYAWNFPGITIQNVIIGNGITEIGAHNFDSDTFHSVTIPDSVTKIGDYAFYGCSSLTSITIPNGVTSIGNGAFAQCISLTSMTIPTSVTRIEGETFQGCKSLASMTIPSSVTKIGSDAFYDCTGLSKIKLLSTDATIEGQDLDCNTKIYVLNDTMKSRAELAFGNIPTVEVVTEEEMNLL